MHKYEKIYNEIVEDIKSYKLQKDDKVDSERNLMKIHDCSQSTIRNALKKLVEKGYVRVIHGSGYYVNDFLKYQTVNLQGLHELKNNSKIENDIYDFKIIPSDEKTSKKLNIKVGELIVSWHRIRKVDGKEYQYEKTSVPFELFPDLREEDLKGSMYEYIEKQGYRINESIKEISACTLTDIESKRLNIKEKNTPVLLVKNIGYLKNGSIFEYSKNLHPQQTFSFRSNKNQ